MKKNFYIKTKNRLIHTAIPAPGTKSLFKNLSKVESRSMHGQMPIAWDKAKNFNIFDIAGNKFIDFTSTIFVANIGHSNPTLIKYIKLALSKNFLHSYAYINKVREKYIKKLLANFIMLRNKWKKMKGGQKIQSFKENIFKQNFVL